MCVLCDVADHGGGLSAPGNWSSISCSRGKPDSFSLNMANVECQSFWPFQYKDTQVLGLTNRPIQGIHILLTSTFTRTINNREQEEFDRFYLNVYRAGSYAL